MNIAGQKALVIGATKGAGRAVTEMLISDGASVMAVARGAEGLKALSAAHPEVTTLAADAAEGSAAEILKDADPDILVLAGGSQPKMAPLAALSWDEFSMPWQSDTKIAFDFIQATLKLPMRPGGRIINFASGAAMNGSRLSGGYAGAKRMQHFIANYAQAEAAEKGLDLTFATVYPRQLVAGTEIAANAASAYGASTGQGPDAFMAQWDAPLTPQKIATYVREILGKDDPAGAWLLGGQSMEAHG